MKRKNILIMLIVGMSLLLVACGGKKHIEEQRDSVRKENSEKNDKETDSKTDKETDKEIPLEVDKKENEKENTNKKENKKEQGDDKKDLIVDMDYINLPESEGFEYESNGDGTCTLTKIGTCKDEDIVIPEKSPDGDTITKIGEYAFYNAEDITSIVFAGRTMEVDKKAFQFCEFEKLVITGSELTIGDNAFSYCEDIEEIYISNSTIEIGEYAFYDSGKDIDVKLVHCTGTLEKKAFQYSAILNLLIQNSNLEVDDSAFSYCEDISSVLFENSTLEIGEYAFYDAGDNIVVSVNGCSINLEEKAFQFCDLVSLTIADSETVVEENAFSYCEDLTDIMIGADNTTIGSYSFYECTSLVNISIAEESKDDEIKILIDDNAFQFCAVEKVVIGRGAVEIGDNAFSYCENLESVEFKGKSLKVGKYAFYDCPDTLKIKYNGNSYNQDSIEDVK